MEKGVLIVPVNNLKAFRIGWGLLPIHSIMAALKKNVTYFSVQMLYKKVHISTTRNSDSKSIVAY